MREISFRGKRVDNGEWETGSLVRVRVGCHDERDYIADKMTGFHTPIIPKTIGEYTGLKANGTRIFEGDILGYSEHSEHFRYLNNVRFAVFYDNENACFSVERYVNGNYECTKRLAAFNPGEHLEVIGNIHDDVIVIEVKK